MPTKKLEQPFKVYNADGMLNKGQVITGYVELHMDINEHKE